MRISIIGYNQDTAWQKTDISLEELYAYQRTDECLWINVDGLENYELIRQLTEHYAIHPLTLEDILDTDQRPKSEEFDNYIYVIFKSVHSKEKVKLTFEQISIIIMHTKVITFQEYAADPFNGVRRRILNNVGKIRKAGVDYLAYKLMDSLVDEYFTTLDTLGQGIEDFEKRALNEYDELFIRDVQHIKRRLSRLRRIIWPTRESINTLIRFESAVLRNELDPFLKDLLDNIMQTSETVESYYELLSDVMEVNLSVASNRMNRVMKVLTIISTIFIPLTFIVGVYGMNFDVMPELQYPLAYPIVWLIMVLIAGIMLIFFKRRHWF
ncbi:magnesium transporter [Pillotina sp. SPG140]